MLAFKAVFAALFITVAIILSGAQAYADTAPALESAPVLSPAEQQALSLETSRAFRSAVSSLNLQTEMPVKKAIKTTRPIQEPRFSLFALTPAMARILLIIAIVVIVVLVILSFNSNRWSDSRARKLTRANDEEIDTEATAQRMEKAQLEADELAQQGLFAEAMHVLLLQSVNELRRRLAISIAVSLTSREILQRVGLPPESHDVFADIISRVEISYFGSHQPSYDDYAACRISYDSLTDHLRRGVAAA